MIEAKALKRLIRYKLKDHNETQFSDYDIKNALNEALRYISQTQAMQNSDFLETSTRFDQDELNKKLIETEENPELYDFRLKGIELPDNFTVLAGVTNIYGRDLRPVDVTKIPFPHEYKVMGNRIYTGVPAFTLTYKKTVDEIKDLEADEVELPTFCTDIVVKIATMILNNAETDIMLQQIEMMTKSIIPRRRFNNAEMKMPFYC